MSKATSFSLFFLSFVPLWAALLFVDIISMIKHNWRGNIITEICSVLVIFVLLLLSAIRIIYAFSSKKKTYDGKYVIQSVKEEKNITAEYLLSNVLPLIAFDFSLWQQLVLFLIYFVVLAIIYIHHNAFCVSVFLDLIGYRLYRCNLKNEDGKDLTKVILSKKQLLGQRGKTVCLRYINNEYVLDVIP